MRDGVELYTLTYVPKGKPGPFPILMERTPYGAGSPNMAPSRASREYQEAGYIFAFQDVRGKGRSGGDFENVRPMVKPGQKGIDESTDTYDTLDWLIKNVPNNNGKVGLWGISYPGFYAGAGGINSHPALKAISPQAPVNDWFLGDDVHHNGAFFLQETFDFALWFDVPRGQQAIFIPRNNLSAYDFYLQAGALSNFEEKFLQGRLPYWQELLSNTTYNDYWKDRALWRAFKNVKCAVLTVGGWYDKEDLYGALQLYRASEKQNPGIKNYLVMGPWSHGQWAGGSGNSLSQMNWQMPTSSWYRAQVEFPFFERFLRDQNVDEPAEATVFETGANKWHQLPSWPPKQMKPRSIYLDHQGALNWDQPRDSSAAIYLADPAKPNPYVEDYQTSKRAPGDWLAKNQAWTEGRDGTLTYTLPPLAEDLRIAGPIEVKVWLKTTGTDCDLVVKLIDEFPAGTLAVKPDGQTSMAGYQFMVRGDIMRAKFRESYERPKPITPGEPTLVRFVLNDAFHTFRKGHRIKIRLQSYWFPVADRNPNVFMEIPRAKDSDFRSATISILSGGKNASQLVLPVIPQPW